MTCSMRYRARPHEIMSACGSSQQKRIILLVRTRQFVIGGNSAMLRISVIRFVIAFLLLITLGCTAVPLSGKADLQSASPQTSESPISSSTPPDRAPAHRKTKMNEKIAIANNQFGLDLFVKLRQSDKDKNLFFSPISITMAMVMTYNGAAGKTQQEMGRSLKLDEMNLVEIDHKTAGLLKSLKGADPKVELSIANSIWARKGVQFKEDFLSRNQQFFGAEIASLDFADPRSLTRINGWVNKSTNGKIARIIDQIGAQHVMFLINAVYFKGQWQKKFDKTLTRDEPFHLLDGKTKPTPLMSQSGEYRYLRGEKFQAVNLLYGQGDVSLYLFLPDQDSSLNEFLTGFSYQQWEQWTGSFRPTPGDVKIPRFKLDYEKTLNDSLQALGMKSAFAQGQADFSGMRAERDLFISEVKHKAVVEVNEEGTEAAAATSVGISVTSIRPQPQRFSFIADRPFLMAICDQRTGAILFLGAVLEPK